MRDQPRSEVGAHGVAERCWLPRFSHLQRRAEPLEPKQRLADCPDVFRLESPVPAVVVGSLVAYPQPSLRQVEVFLCLPYVVLSRVERSEPHAGRSTPILTVGVSERVSDSIKVAEGGHQLRMLLRCPAPPFRRPFCLSVEQQQLHRGGQIRWRGRFQCQREPMAIGSQPSPRALNHLWCPVFYRQLYQLVAAPGRSEEVRDVDGGLLVGPVARQEVVSDPIHCPVMELLRSES